MQTTPGVETMTLTWIKPYPWAKARVTNINGFLTANRARKQPKLDALMEELAAQGWKTVYQHTLLGSIFTWTLQRPTPPYAGPGPVQFT